MGAMTNASGDVPPNNMRDFVLQACDSLLVLLYCRTARCQSTLCRAQGCRSSSVCSFMMLHCLLRLVQFVLSRGGSESLHGMQVEALRLWRVLAVYGADPMRLDELFPVICRRAFVDH